LVNVIPFEKPVPFRRVALAFRKSSVKKDAIDQIAQIIKGVDLETFNP